MTCYGLVPFTNKYYYFSILVFSVNDIVWHYLCMVNLICFVSVKK